jgi:hypothetical protein
MKHSWDYRPGLPPDVECCVRPGCTFERQTTKGERYLFRPHGQAAWSKTLPPCGRAPETAAATSTEEC